MENSGGWQLSHHLGFIPGRDPVADDTAVARSSLGKSSGTHDVDIGPCMGKKERRATMAEREVDRRE